MAIVQLPVGRLAGHAERLAFRQGLARLSSSAGQLRVVETRPGPGFCMGCAAPIDFAPVWRRGEAFCSVECSLGGDRPA